MQEAKLTADNVIRIVAECLPVETPATTLGLRRVLGLSTIFGFQRDLLEERRDQIIEMVSEVPARFIMSEGSLLDVGRRRDNTVWTEDDSVKEQFCCLAIAIGYAGWIGDRKMWKNFRGEMPYVVFGDMGTLSEPDVDDDGCPEKPTKGRSFAKTA